MQSSRSTSPEETRLGALRRAACANSCVEWQQRHGRLAQEIWSSGKWVDRFVGAGTRAKVLQTMDLVSNRAGESHALHSDPTADLYLCVGLDKGWRDTPTAQLVATVAN